MTTTVTAPRELAATFHRALSTKDWALLREIMHPDVTWTLPGDNAVSGTAAGIDEVIARARQIAAYGLTFTLERVLLSRNNMALGLHNTAHEGGRVLDQHLATVCTLHKGRIVQVETYLDDVDGMNTFFAGGA